jgi:predicted N-formylglutamate amidohydrolase
MQTDAFSTLGRPKPQGILFTCEHASNRIPAPWRPRPADQKLLQLHWGYDIGARNLTEALVGLGLGDAVMARFSRLLIDCNREPSDPTAILEHCDEGSPHFNQRLSLEERTRRIQRFHKPFHQALDARLQSCPARLLISIHSFTPSFRGQSRPWQAGVLFDRFDELAESWVAALQAQGLNTAANEPYSGKAGLIYSASRHGHTHKIPYLELEIRQDCIASKRAAKHMARKIAASIQAAGL